MCWTHKEGGVLEGGGLRRALAVDRHSSLERRGFAHVAGRQSQVLHIEGAGRGNKNKAHIVICPCDLLLPAYVCYISDFCHLVWSQKRISLLSELP